MKSASFLLGAIVLLATGGGVLTTACSSDSTPGAALTPSSACADAIDAIYGDPGALAADPAKRGDVLKCTKDANLTKEALQTKITELGYAGKPLTSGAQVYRISYRTERGDKASTPSASSAIVYIPDVPRAAKLPIVIAARGSRGQAPQCAVSKFDPSAAGINGDAYRMVYPLVGQGYAVIMTDLAGYANFGAPKNPPSAYAQATDIAHSTLDSGRALKKLFPALDDKVVIVGHSQGGHSALASLALADAYGTAAPIVGVAVYAPLWLNQRAFAAVMVRALGKDFPVDKSAAPAVSVWYHYTQAELLDGPGEGKKLFAPAKADALEAFVKTACWEQKAEKLLPLGTYADEYFDPAFVNTVAKPALGVVGGCATTDQVCLKWMARYSADRPHLTGTAATTPIFLAYGGKDTTIRPDLMKCALDRLSQEAKALTVCVDPEKDHGGIVSAQSDRVGDWIASVALGAPAPAACAQNASAVAVPCFTPPPND
jgi:pimeloyl-ACP methyl ester carboxylesterase